MKEKLNVKLVRNQFMKYKEFVLFRYILVCVFIRLWLEDSVINFKMIFDDMSVFEFFQIGFGVGVFGFN